MAALLALLRATRRSGARGLVGLALIIGMAGGAVLTGVEAYRRTDSAFDRLVDDTEAWDVLVNPDSRQPAAPSGPRMSPPFRWSSNFARADGLSLSPRTIDSIDDLDSGPTFFASDGQWGYEFARPLIREGRMPAVDASDEAFVSAAAADSMDLEVGDRLESRLLSLEDFGVLEEAGGVQAGDRPVQRPATGRLIDFEVVGVGQAFDEIVVDEGFGGGSVIVGPAFVEAYEPFSPYWGGLIRLRPGSRRRRLPGRGRGAGARRADRLPVPRRRSRTRPSGPCARRSPPWRCSPPSPRSSALVIVGQAISRRLQADAVALAPIRGAGRDPTAAGGAGPHPDRGGRRGRAPCSPWSSPCSRRRSPRWAWPVTRSRRPGSGSIAGAGPGRRSRGPRVRGRRRASRDRGRPDAGSLRPSPSRSGRVGRGRRPGPVRRWPGSASPSTRGAPRSRPARRWWARPPASP